MTNDNAQFDTRLREIASDHVRPLLCDGNPFECEVFLIGINPKSNISFWNHWQQGRCNKREWLLEYQHKVGKLSRTRQRIEILCTALSPIKVLETNVYAPNSSREADLESKIFENAVLDFLLCAIRPEVVVVYGGSARDNLEYLLGKKLPRNDFVSVTYGSHSFSAISTHHLSYSTWSAEKVSTFGHSLRTRLQDS